MRIREHRSPSSTCGTSGRIIVWEKKLPLILTLSLHVQPNHSHAVWTHLSSHTYANIIVLHAAITKTYISHYFHTLSCKNRPICSTSGKHFRDFRFESSWIGIVLGTFPSTPALISLDRGSVLCEECLFSDHPVILHIFTGIQVRASWWTKMLWAVM